MCLNVTRPQSGEDKKGNLWQRPVSSHWCTWSPGSGAHSLFIGMWKQQENTEFKIYSTNVNFPGLLEGKFKLALPGFRVYTLT